MFSYKSSFQEGVAFVSPLERGLGGVLFPPMEALLYQVGAVGEDNTPLPLSRGETRTVLFHGMVFNGEATRKLILRACGT